MADIHSKTTRSFNMSQIRGKNTKPEILVRKYLHSRGLRFRIHDKRFDGKPDIILPKYKTAIFVHGCFWHGHKDCKYFVMPKTRTEWWLKKIQGNILNDKKNLEVFEKIGWKVFEIWECELKKKDFHSYLNKLVQKITEQSQQNQV